MTSYEMVEKLSEKKGVTAAQAKEALERSNWDMLDAVIYLDSHPEYVQQEKTAAANSDSAKTVYDAQPAQPTSKQSSQGSIPNYSMPNSNGSEQVYTAPNTSGSSASKGTSFSELLGRFFGFVGKVITMGIENSVIISKGDKTIATIPVIVMILLLCLAFYVVVPIVVISLFFDFRYSFSGPGSCKDKVNNAMSKVADTSERIKNDFMTGVEQGKK